MLLCGLIAPVRDGSVKKQTEIKMNFPTIEDFIGNTPLVRTQRLAGVGSNVLLLKLEGNNPAGSVKDRPAISMIRHAETRGDIKPGDTLIEATSGNTGIALAMAAAIRGYPIILIMPESASLERRAAMKAFGAQILLVSKEQGMEGARDLADEMQQQGKGIVLNQFANPDNPRAHYEGTGPEIWRDTGGGITHLVSSMGTTGTIMGTSKFLKEKNPSIQIVGVQPTEGSAIPGIRRWPTEYIPKIFEPARVDRVIDISQAEAEDMTRHLAATEGIFCGISSGGAVAAAIRLCATVQNAMVVTIIADRGDRYISTNVFPP
jgi:cysteine synthase B